MPDRRAAARSPASPAAPYGSPGSAYGTPAPATPPAAPSPAEPPSPRPAWGVDMTLALYRALIDHLDVAVLVADDSANYLEANEAACRLFRRGRDGIVGHHLSEFVVDGTLESVNAQWRVFLRDGVQSGVFPLKLAPGIEVLASFNARANVLPGLHCSFLNAVERPPSGPDVLTLCAWTHRVSWKGGWVSLEQYLREAHGVSVSHGMCPEAFDAIMGGAQPK
ncbi:hypothetical protein DFJ74DRAFT_694455 [Hyaloraphidium curvatum]|nr:hypothetical protein DFJ74DRAFT_694455 [Hyaloraphidium curvatum]